MRTLPGVPHAYAPSAEAFSHFFEPVAALLKRLSCPRNGAADAPEYKLHLFVYICRMKRLTTTLALLAAALYATAQEATLPTPDAKALGMGGVAMTTLSGSHAIYNNSATAIFSQMPSQVSSSYYGQGEFDYYAVTGFCRFDNVNLAQIGWRQYLRERGNNDMAVDLGYSRRLATGGPSASWGATCTSNAPTTRPTHWPST